MSENTKLIGYCSVDSGQIMLSDPCYVEQFRVEMDEPDGKFDATLEPVSGSYPYTYNGASSATCSKQSAGALGGGLGVVVTSGYGDGSYPVYATYNSEGRVIEARIVFDDYSKEIDKPEFGNEQACGNCGDEWEDLSPNGYCDECENAFQSPQDY